MSSARVLVVGGGGREHALAWALARSPEVAQVYSAPGNAGTSWPAAAGRAAAANVALDSGDVPGLLAFAREQQIDLTVVGPEATLAAGIADAFQAAGLPIFGPTQAAAQLESSKAFAKAFMLEHAIATAEAAMFSDYAEAERYLAAREQQPDHDPAIVVKADGLAAGKGVAVCANAAEARAALQRTMVARDFGAAGERVVLEACLRGREVSLMAFSDGRTVVPMLPARDHKRLLDHDEGPNTGGMGVYAPAPDVTPDLIQKWTDTILQPTVTGMAARGTPYVGVLYAGLMLTEQGAQVLEFNCRFGDPEAQVVLPLLADADAGGASLFAILRACTQGQIDQVAVRWRAGACAAVVLASGGYPGSYARGMPISGLDEIARQPDLLVFHAGTAHGAASPDQADTQADTQADSAPIVTAGGRVLAVSALGADLPAALERAYAGVAALSFAGMHYRRDIGRQDSQHGP